MSILKSRGEDVRSPIRAQPGGRGLMRRTLPTQDDGNGRALEALTDVTRQLEASRDLPDFMGRITRTVAALLPCGRAAFWLLDRERACLAVQPDAFGLPFGAHLSVRCAAEGDGIAERIVHDDWTLLGDIGGVENGDDPLFEVLHRIGAYSAIVVAWRAGDSILGAISALDSSAPGGFSVRDAHLLRLLGLGAGLAWQRRRKEEAVVRRRDVETAGLRAEADRVTSLEHVKSDFLKLASHELRAPVSVLRGYLSMMADGSLGPIDNSEVTRLLPVLEDKVEEIDRLVADMLETARLDDQRLYLRLESADLCALTRECMGSFTVPGDLDHPLSLLAGRAPAQVRVDRRRVAMIISNLLSNAHKYSPDGGDIDVECRAEPAAGVARLVVTDHGIGIEPADLPRLFTRFGRIVTPATDAIPGTGLGLYLAREVARLHGGDLTVTSTPGRGSAFTLSLPLTDGTSAAAPA